MAFERTEHGKGHELIHHHFRPHQIPDRRGVFPGNAQQPCHWSQRIAKQGLKCGVKATQAQVDQVNERHKRHQHGGNVQRQMEPVGHSA